jgi:hypothetical protein
MATDRWEFATTAGWYNRQVRLNEQYDNLPGGTTGRIVSRDFVKGELAVVVEWELVERVNPRHDLFRRDEFERLLTVIS